MRYFSNLFGKELYMFRTGLLSSSGVLIPIAMNTVLRILMMDNKSVRNT
jgi:hypothetical protein